MLPQVLNKYFGDEPDELMARRGDHTGLTEDDKFKAAFIGYIIDIPLHGGESMQ